MEQIESHRLKTLEDDSSLTGAKQGDAFDFDAIEKSLNKPADTGTAGASEFGFLSELGVGKPAN